MASSNSFKKPYRTHLDPTMRKTSTPMYSSLNDSGYNSSGINLPYTPFLNLEHRNMISTPNESPLPPSSFSGIHSSDSVVQVLFEDEDHSKNTESFLEYSTKDYSLGTSFNPAVTKSSELPKNVPDLSAKRNVIPQLSKQYISVFRPGDEIGACHIDFFRELGHYRNCIHIVYKVCHFLEPKDLVSAGQVCHTWRKLIENHPALKRRRTAYVESRSHRGCFGKENHTLNGKSRPRVQRPLFNPFRAIGNQVDDPPKLSPVKSEIPAITSRLPLFQEQAKKLLPCEHLQPCPRCQSPSRVTPGEKRAHCTRDQCSFDYCTQCRDNFHAPTPCKKSSFVGMCGRSPHKRDLIGHKGARRNLKRL